nr:acyltransferase [Paenibacillus sp. sptzw28]
MVNTASNFAVPAFLFLSSVVLLYRYDVGTNQNWTVFYRKRFKTIVVPYLLWSLFYSTVVLYTRHSSILDGLFRFLKGLPIGGSYSHLYFIIVIAQFYLLFPLFHLLLRIGFIRNHPLLCGAAAQTAFYLLNHYWLHMYKVGTFIGSYLLYFFLGAYAAMKLKSNERGASQPARWMLYAEFAVSAVVYIYQMWLQRTSPHWLLQPWLSYLNFVTNYTYSAISCLILMQVSAFIESGRFRLVNKSLFSIGKYSFGIYLLHPFFLLVWRYKIMIGGPLVYHVLTWAGGAVALTLSWLATAIIQKSHLGTFVVGKSDVRQLFATQVKATKSA